MNEQPSQTKAIVSFSASRTSSRCPFGNQNVSFQLYPGSCVCLTGNSGAGKTTLATHLAGLSSKSSLSRLGIHVEKCDWDESIPIAERCGVLFQQTTLLDALTVAGNVCVALEACPTQTSFRSESERDAKIKEMIEAVGLDYARDASKRPAELSGGMARRASLALQLAQRKHCIVLDEPFTGLDRESAASVAKELVRIRKERDTALVLISHEPDIAALVMNGNGKGGGTTIALEPPPLKGKEKLKGKPSLFGKGAFERFLAKLADYIFWSLPLILLTFLATGLAIGMLSSDILRRIDVTDQVVGIVEKEVQPLLKVLTGEEQANPMTMLMIKMKVRGMINSTMPGAKAKLYALGMAKLFVLEIGPLLTALLLAGRIGGSYAGEVATMRATAQNKLLRTLGISPQLWTLGPALTAALLASPLLTVLGTVLALFLGGLVGPKYGIGSFASYSDEVWDASFPSLRLRSFLAWEESEPHARSIVSFLSTLDLRSSFSESYLDAVIELSTYPPVYMLTKAATYILIILVVAEGAARLPADLTPRGVPHVITSSVVLASLLVIVADWGFSQLLLKRQ